MHDWDGALAYERDRHRLGAHAMARDAAGGVGAACEHQVNWASVGMMGTLVAGSLCALLVALPNAQAQGPETCVKDARAALKADSPRAFGAGAIVEGPKTTEMVEREEFAGIADPEWEEFKRHVRPGDCIMFFRTSPYSWAMSFGSEGYVLVREGQIVRCLATKFQ